MLNALSFDVEDYFHAHAFDGVIPRTQWDSIPARVLDNTRLILQLLRQNKTRATFFILGWVAERHPRRVAGVCRTMAGRPFDCPAARTRFAVDRRLWGGVSVHGAAGRAGSLEGTPPRYFFALMTVTKNG